MKRIVDKFSDSIVHTLLSLPGWSTDRKFIVIESDDWGSLRMRSREAFEELISKGLPISSDPYSRFDCLENQEDLVNLMDVLTRHKDKNGRSPAFTLNCVSANPDFAKIKATNFERYYFEPVLETYRRLHGDDRVLRLIKEGLAAKIFMPQFHGREHLHVDLWMRALQNPLSDARLAFKQEVFAVNIRENMGRRKNLMAAFDLYSENELDNQEKILEEGLSMFERLWGFRSTSLIAPCFTWTDAIERISSTLGVKFIQGIAKQRNPIIGKRKVNYVFHYQGQRNKYQQRYLVRNAFFEPTVIPSDDAITGCLNRISIAFRCRKPAIIGTHRINFIGGLDVRNRTDNLKKLDLLLQTIVRKWPDVEFLTTDELGNYMSDIGSGNYHLNSV